MDEIIVQALTSNDWNLLRKIQDQNVNLLHYSFNYKGQVTNIIEYIVENIQKCTFLKQLYDYDTDSKHIVQVVISRLFIEKFASSIDDIESFLNIHAKHFDFIPLNDVYLYSFDTCYFDFDSTFIDKIKFLITKGLDLNTQGIFGRSILQTIFKSRKCLTKDDLILLDFLKYLDEEKYDLNQVDVFGYNLLHYAIQNRNAYYIIDFLISKTNFSTFKTWDKSFLSNTAYVNKEFNQRLIQIGILSFYPLIKELHINNYANSNIMIPESYQSIFRSYSLEHAILHSLGFCSKKIYKTVLDNMFLVKGEKTEIINYDLFGLLKILNKSFVLNKKKINVDYICFIIENFKTKECLEFLSDEDVDCNDCLHFLGNDDIESLSIIFSLFSELQIKLIIENSSIDGLLMSELNVLIMMNPAVLNHLKRIKFGEKNSFSKIFFAIKSMASKQQQPCFSLNQTSFMQYDLIQNFPIQAGVYQIVIADNNHQLIDWGVLAHNCIGDGDYAIKARKGDSLLLGAFYLEKLIATIEIQHKRIIQIKGVYLVKEQEKQIVELLQNNKVIF